MTRVPPSIDELTDHYAELERRVHATVASLSHGFCAGCASPCCEPDHCENILESRWLLAVAARAGHAVSHPAKPGERLSFLGATGCTLPVGRPIQCTGYVCTRLDDLLPDAVTRFVYRVLSDVLSHVVRNVRTNEHLVDTEDLSRLTDKQRLKVDTRIREAHLCIDTALRLLERKDESRPVTETAADLLFLNRLLPFSARATRA